MDGLVRGLKAGAVAGAVTGVLVSFFAVFLVSLIGFVMGTGGLPFTAARGFANYMMVTAVLLPVLWVMLGMFFGTVFVWSYDRFRGGTPLRTGVRFGGVIAGVVWLATILFTGSLHFSGAFVPFLVFGVLMGLLYDHFDEG